MQLAPGQRAFDRIADRVKKVSSQLLNANLGEAEQIEGYICIKAFVDYLKKSQLDTEFSVTAPLWLEKAAEGNLALCNSNPDEKAIFLKTCFGKCGKDCQWICQQSLSNTSEKIKI